MSPLKSIRGLRRNLDYCYKFFCSESTASNELFTGHRLTYSEFGDPQAVIRKERLTIKNVPNDHVIVKMLASPVNPADLNTIQGMYPVKPNSFPAVPGNEGVGKVVQVASSSTGNGDPLEKDDWVIPQTPCLGTWQAYLTGREEDFIKIKKMDLSSAATISVNPCTAYRLLNDFEKLKKGDVVIQNGGNSAVGQAVIQLCREMGLKCVSLVRPRPEFKEIKARLVSLGNADTIVISEDDLRAVMKDFSAQLALNCVGGKSATDMLRVIDKGRTMVTYGGMSRQPVIIPTSALIFRNVKVVGFWMTQWNFNSSIEERKKMLNYISDLVISEKWSPPENTIIPLAKYREALDNAMKGYSNTKYIIQFE